MCREDHAIGPSTGVLDDLRADAGESPDAPSEEAPKVGNNPLRPAVLLGDSLTHGVGQIHVHASLEIPLLQSNVYLEYSDLVKPDG